MQMEADVCIVGGGPGGLMLGYLLSKRQISVIVIERMSRLHKDFRGEHLNAEGEAVLAAEGLLADLDAAGMLLMERLEYMDKGRILKVIEPGPGERHMGIHVPQKHLLGVLAAHAEKNDGFELMLNTTVTDMIFNDQGGAAGVMAKCGELDIAIHSKLVVGADGRYSTVRKLARIPYQVHAHGYDLLWARIPSPPGWEPTVRMARVNGMQLALFTQQGGWIQIGWNIAEGSYPLLRKQSVDPLRQALIEACPELARAVPDWIRDWKDFVLLQVHSSSCESWVKDGVVLLGDAAHTFSPTGAYGVNGALKDAEVLLPIVEHALHAGRSDAGALKLFEQLRRPQVEEQQAVQREKERSFAEMFASLVS
ncbi:FAD-dependent monooxygenase [Paenibacillus sp. JX-17]|uniref:FAD-dependent monooxygenase n=1 Tax=Paenibacillus lacisoli TaxID=3064525 RepID=A0ABT9CFV3_9BACL|nr:FAD-dependent monooxygenase [Paenibacillus sp. JX-17]MDO7906822.1 FAD-dependent monooxygenase [Paenibacillus sp. JX-17]